MADSEITVRRDIIKNLNPVLLFIYWVSLTGIRAILCSSALFVLCGLLYSRKMNYSDKQVYSENKMAPRQIQIEEDTLQFLSSTGWNLFSWEWIASRMCLAGGKLHRRLSVQFQIANSEQTCFLFRCNYIRMDECATTCQCKQFVMLLISLSTPLHPASSVVWICAMADQKNLIDWPNRTDSLRIRSEFVIGKEEILGGWIKSHHSNDLACTAELEQCTKATKWSNSAKKWNGFLLGSFHIFPSEFSLNAFSSFFSNLAVAVNQANQASKVGREQK